MTTLQAATPGIVAILGSGEATAAGRRVLADILPRLPEPRTVAVLDSPAGFQPNHVRVAGKVADFIGERLGEYHPRLQVVETRRDAQSSPQGEKAVAAILSARCIVAGPGSPSYMIRELRDTTYFDAVRQAHRNGVALYISSAASIAMSALSVPVYEIFKVGAEPFWNEGLDLLGPFGMHLAIVPHWNNSEGGVELDTRFCYMGQERFERLRTQLPSGIVMLGIDEHSACVLDFAGGTVTVAGNGGARVLRDGHIVEFANGDIFPMDLLGADRTAIERLGTELAGEHLIAVADDAPLPEPASTLNPWVEEDSLAAKIPPVFVDRLLAIRSELRAAHQWAFADQLRDAMTEIGFIIEDTSDGSRWSINEFE